MPQDDPCRQAKWNDETITVTQSSDHDVPTLLTLTSHKIRQALYQTVTFSWILKRKWFTTIFPLQEHSRLSACLPACFSGMSLPTWHITQALHWCRQWAISASSMIAMIWVGKSITWPPGKSRTPGRSLVPSSAIIPVFFSASKCKPLFSLFSLSHGD